MKMKTDLLKAGLGFMALIALAVFVTYAAMRTIQAEVDLKAQIAKPNAQWIDRHGNDLDSWQTFNIAVLVSAERKRQEVIK